MLKEEKGASKLVLIIIVFLLIIALVVLGFFVWYNLSLKEVQKDSQKVIVEIQEGSGISGIADLLEQNGLIKSATAFKIYCRLNEDTAMQAGKYELDKNMSVEQIINELQNGNVVDETVTITFVEGRNMRWIANTIAENTDNTEEDVYNLLLDEEYLDSLIEEYWFITDEIKNDDIYYSLEGYLYPDTYTLANRSEDVRSIFKRMLDKTESVLDDYRTAIEESDYTVHELLSLASVVELEAKNDEDRAEVAGVFYNRLDRGMALQSDVTTYYAFKIDMSERDLTADELSTDNPYNTRSSEMAGEIPVGPICMVSETSIAAVVNPVQTDAIFFVADKNGKVYFSETNQEHEEKIQELKDEGLWYTYED